MLNQLTFMPLGGVGDVTKNMYLYQYGDYILIVDCGLGFVDETVLGVDLVLPDISYLLDLVNKFKKKIIGMLLTHGHEDHIGALPFILPQLNSNFPIFGTPMTAALVSDKLKEYGVNRTVQTVDFNKVIDLGYFRASFIRITHSVPDSANIFIESPVGNLYHGSDFKFDPQPFDKKQSDIAHIKELGDKKILCLMSDCLGSERKGVTPSESTLTFSFEKELGRCKGKFIVTTYSSHVSRINQIIEASSKFNRKVCLIGRSLQRVKEVALRLGYIHIKDGQEIKIEDLKNYRDDQLVLIAAGSQGQENSAMARIANGEVREIKLTQDDVIVFSSSPIPGNEVSVYSLIDTMAKRGSRVIYPEIDNAFHVSGHGSVDELAQMIDLTRPKFLLPISGMFRHMVAYRNLGEEKGYSRDNILLVDDGQEIIFSNSQAKFGRKFHLRNVYVDQISGEQIENVALRDRQQLSEGGLVIVIAQIDVTSATLINKPEIISRGFTVLMDNKIRDKLQYHLVNLLNKRKTPTPNWVYLRKFIEDASERMIYRKFHRHPLVLAILLET